MSSQFIEAGAPAGEGKVPKRPEDLPHGLLTPPERVKELLALEKAKFPPERFTPAVEERLLNEWTVAHYFEPLVYEVSYRPTPEGPEVLAVGFDEILALRRRIGEEEYRKLRAWMP
jgi:hypothetical protein